jgi:tRNA pseudouridine55 synthase
MKKLATGIMSLENEYGVPVFTRTNLDELRDSTEILTGGGVLLIDKPSSWTSFDVVAKTRRLLKIRKIGHAGTLDPMATGLLILCLGKATKLVERIQAGVKEYTGMIHFGATTPTDDAESAEQQQFPVDHLTESMIRAGAESFVGESLQIPPSYSARKVGGQRLYKIARRGEKVEAPPKLITVYEFQITAMHLPDVEFRVVCSKGTYIRSLARDLGEKLGSGAYLTALRRTRSGEFSIEDAITIPELVGALAPEEKV